MNNQNELGNQIHKKMKSLDLTNKPEFNGDDYQPDRDKDRLTGQIQRVYNFIKDGLWYTLRQISDGTKDPEASVSAQLRHLRKERFGSHKIEKEYIDKGLYKYRLVGK